MLFVRLLLGKPKDLRHAHTPFCVTTCHMSGHARGRDAQNRGVMLTTGAVTLITWAFGLETRSYMPKNGSEAPGQDAVGASW